MKTPSRSVHETGTATAEARRETRRYTSVEEVTTLVKAFEDGTLPPSAWSHGAHLTVAAWYLSALPEREATNRMIAEIRRYNRRHGLRTRRRGGYHETLTLFWLAMVRRFLARARGVDLAARINGLIRYYNGRKELPLEYYSEELLWSDRARQSWVPPDRRPLED